jgi:hypothetical protein
LLFSNIQLVTRNMGSKKNCFSWKIVLYFLEISSNLIEI